jgi:hypothetical protein
MPTAHRTAAKPRNADGVKSICSEENTGSCWSDRLLREKHPEAINALKELKRIASECSEPGDNPSVSEKRIHELWVNIQVGVLLEEREITGFGPSVRAQPTKDEDGAGGAPEMEKNEERPKPCFRERVYAFCTDHSGFCAKYRKPNQQTICDEARTVLAGKQA